MVLAVNARFREGARSGVQRVAHELLRRIAIDHREICPDPRLAVGTRGHAWEQVVLPLRTRSDPLWSPCNTGPIAITNQVVNFHDAAIFDHPEWFSPNFVRMYRALWPRLARRVRRIVTVSDHARTRIAASLGIPLDRIEVVWNGVSDEFRPAPQTAIDAVADRYGVVPQRYFVTLSTVEPRKNLPLVIDAWERTEGKIDRDLKLLVIGGAGVSHIFRNAQLATGASDRLSVTGFVDEADLPALIGGAAALLYPSRYEGFGLPIAEAMACGTPALTTRLTSLPEVGGDAALYVDPDDPDDLAKTVVRLAESPAMRADYRALGLARAGLFGWDQAADKMRHILRRDLTF
jgi:glycosyltransferase involved in cell wall biosynthesis